MKTNKTNLTGLSLLFGFFFFGAHAQKIPNSGLGMGFQINQYQADFGFGGHITSPYFFNNSMAVRLKGNLMFNEHLSNDEIIWTPYSNLSLGFIGGSGFVNDFIRLYGEGGVIALFPSSTFSSNEAEIGGYGLFGFEFYLGQSTNYFIEIGGVGTGATADRVDTKPIYSNGLLLSAGFRIHFQRN